MRIGPGGGGRSAALLAALAILTLAEVALSQEGPASSVRPAEAAVEPTLTPAEIARRALPAVVEVVTYRDGRKLGGGSGFLVGPEGLVVTSHHVLEGAERAEVVLHSGETYEVLHVAGADDRRDLAVLRIAGFDLPVIPLGDSREVEVGDRIVVIGSPLGLASTVSDGLVSAKREIEGRRVLQVSAPISSGSSGGPVFDARGRVVAVLAGYMRRGQNVNFAVPVEYARGLLDIPERTLPVAAVGRKRVSLLGREGSRGRGLSLHAVLVGGSVPGEEETPWALQPRRVRPEEVRADPARSADQLSGAWEIRELTRVPGSRSGLYRGVLLSDGERLRGAFFGGLVSDPEFDAAFRADRVRDFEARLDVVGRVTLEGEQGCTYFLQASPAAMTGVYECVEDGDTYDLGAVELRRVEGPGPSGRYRVVERLAVGGADSERPGEAALFALEDGRWLGGVATGGTGRKRVVALRAGRWTRDGYLAARLGETAGARVDGRFDRASLELGFPAGGDEYPVGATLQGRRLEASAP